MCPAFLSYPLQAWIGDLHRRAQRDAPVQAVAPTAHPKERHAMQPAPRAGNAVTGTRDQAGAAGTRAPAPVTPRSSPRKARALLPRRAGRPAPTALPAAASSDRPGSARAEIRGDLLRRVAALLRRAPKTAGGYRDPLFERPEVVEDDYYRFRNRPNGGSRLDARSPG